MTDIWFIEVQWKPQICQFFSNIETQKHQILCNMCFICIKIISGSETGEGAGAELGACALPWPGRKLNRHCLMVDQKTM